MKTRQVLLFPDKVLTTGVSLIAISILICILVVVPKLFLAGIEDGLEKAGLHVKRT